MQDDDTSDVETQLIVVEVEPGLLLECEAVFPPSMTRDEIEAVVRDLWRTESGSTHGLD